MWRQSRPHIPAGAPASGGISTKVGSEGSTCALKYALEMSMNDSCILSGDSGAQVLLSPSNWVTAKLKTVLRASSGGVGAKTESVPGCLICLATRRHRTFGLRWSHLLVQAHLTLMGGRPVSLRHSAIGTSFHTPLASKYASSLAFPAATSSSGRGWPVRSSTTPPRYMASIPYSGSFASREVPVCALIWFCSLGLASSGTEGHISFDSVITTRRICSCRS